MFNFSTATSALRANQVALDVVGNNIANANTPNYHRQDARFMPREGVLRLGLRIGQGVDISEINRAYDSATEDAITANISELEKVAVQSRTLGRLETLFTPGHGTVLEKIENFFNEVERLSAHPDNLASRSVVLRSAQNVAIEINDLGSQLDGITAELDQLVDVTLREIEQKSQQLIDIDVEIRLAEFREESPNDLLDRRSQLVSEMAALIDVRAVKNESLDARLPFQKFSYQLAETQIAFMAKPLELESRIDEFGNLVIAKVGSEQEFTVAGGKLGGYLAARNGNIAKHSESLREFTGQLVGALDTVHASGVGLTGSFKSLVGQRSIGDNSTPLSEADSIVAIQSGSLFISVTGPDGQRNQHEVVVDPASQSADDLAAEISNIAHLTASSDASTGKLILGAEEGYEFDFRAALPTDVDNVLISGTTEPEVTGQYSGTKNEQYTFNFLNGGDVGLTQGLQVEVTDSNGVSVARLDVGRGYEPGTELLVDSGISIKFSQGTAIAGDSFELHGVTKSDTSGVLAAFGLNTLFVGDDAKSIQVDPRLLENQEQFATTISGNPLDTSNVLKMLSVRDEPIFSGGTQTAEEFFTDMIASVGVEVLQLAGAQDSLEEAGQTLKDRQAAISGVDLNEEAVKLIQFQKAFQANARYIVVIDEMLQELFNIIR